MPIGWRMTQETLAWPPNMNRALAAWLTISSTAQSAKSEKRISTTGIWPASAMPTEAPMIVASEIGVYVADRALQIFGGYGYVKDFPAEKFYRDMKLCTIGEGTSEIQRMVIARNLLAEVN